MRQSLEELAKGSAQPNLSPIETANMSFSSPSASVFEEYSRAATPFIKKVMKNKLQIQTLEKLRETLLPKLMSGEASVCLRDKRMQS